MLQLNLLGGLSLRSHGGSAPAAALQKRRLALLAIVGIAGDRGISRDRIQAYLWPESDSHRARHALDQLVYATRRALETDPFVMEGSELRLDSATIVTDIARFEEATLSSRLEEAANLYGGRLLYGAHIATGSDLDQWIEAEATRLEEIYRKSLETLAATAASAGDRPAAVQWRRTLLASDPLSARSVLALMHELADAGDKRGAVLQARTYQDLVRKELGIEPAPEVEDYASALAQGAAKVPSSSNALAKPNVLPPSIEPSGTAIDSDRGPSRRTRSRVAVVTVLVLGIVTLGIATAFFQRPPSRESTSDETAARNAYLRGQVAWEDRSSSSLDTAVVYFRKATKLDPSYAGAYAGLANAYVMIGYSGYRRADAMFPKAKAAAMQAIALDSTQAAPWAALGMELTWERDFKNAARAYRRALSLDPSYATAHQWYGILLRITGDISGSVAETRKAAELEPLSLQIQNNYASFLSGAGQNEAALRHYQKVVGEEPDSAWVRRNPWLLTNMASVYAAEGRYDDALRFAERAVTILPGHPRAMLALAGVYRAMGKDSVARAVFDRSDKSNTHYPAYRALFFAAEGQADSAFAWFGKVDDWGIPVMISLRGLKGIKSDPRYDLLLKRLKMN